MGVPVEPASDGGGWSVGWLTGFATTGRVAAIVPREFAAEGYLDMRHDDFEEGGILTYFQESAKDAKHRSEFPARPLRAKLS